tara:strand:- start:4486 stop:5073 length:588 start_codon:yes stop_codon:yes gene_type:complete
MNKDGLLQIKHKTHFETLIRFILLLAVFMAYCGYLTYEYGLATGGLVGGLTWSFFVLCTPIADAGFLLDFPVRILTGVRMIIMEIVVWAIAIVLNVYAVFYSPEIYETTFLTTLLYKIIMTPIPYWGIILLCGIGTFLSIYFGDEMMDVFKHKECTKFHSHGFVYRLIAMVAFFVLIVLAYYHLLESLDIHIPSI